MNVQNLPTARPAACRPDQPDAERMNALASLQSVATLTRWRREQEICSQESAGENWYCVLSGAARKCLVRPDGERQIVDLLLPGDFFGFTAEETPHFAVQAIKEDTIVAYYPRRRLEALADADPAVAREIRRLMFRIIARLQEQVLVLGRTTAIEKVGAFLLNMSERLPERDTDGVSLPMSRYDIADYLGISVETVSRAITGLKLGGLIFLEGTRYVRIVDRNGLSQPHRDA